MARHPRSQDGCPPRTEARAPRAAAPAATPDKQVEAEIAQAAEHPQAAPDGHGPEAFGAAISGFLQSLGGLQVPQTTLSELQQRVRDPGGDGVVERRGRPDPRRRRGRSGQERGAKPIGDRRFAAADWMNNPASAFTAQLYLLNARTLTKMADSLQGDEKTRARVKFAVQQFADAASPANYLALNPEAQRKALETTWARASRTACSTCGATCSKATCRRRTRACSRSAATSRPAPAPSSSRTSTCSSSSTSR